MPAHRRRRRVAKPRKRAIGGDPDAPSEGEWNEMQQYLRFKGALYVTYFKRILLTSDS